MTPDDVRKCLDAIRSAAVNDSDDETAHSLEDDMRRAVLQAIADGYPDATELAKLALTSDDISFARWCA